MKAGLLVLEKRRSGRESFAGQVLSLIEAAITSRSRNEVIADSVSRFFVPAVFSIAVSTAFVLWFLGFPSQEVLLRGLTVLLIACPCSRGLAMPLVKVAVVSVARKQDFLIRNPDAIERMRNIDIAIFDKTGTLTEGGFMLQEVLPDDEGEDQSDTLAQLAAVERCSTHLLAREVLRAAAKRQLLPEFDVDDYQVTEGLGIMGTIRGRPVYIGNRRFMAHEGLRLSPNLESRAEHKERQGINVVFYGWDHKVKGLPTFGDTVRGSARQAVQELTSKGVAVWIVSGDSVTTTQTVSRQLGIDRCIGEAVPGDKAAPVRKLQDEGHRVAMIGDGINDAPAIAQADVGFAIASSNDIVRQASDITLLASEPTALNTAFNLSLRASRTVVQNLAFAFAYNACAIPLAVAGLLNPPIAVCTMFVSSLTATANALRLFKQA